MKSNYCRNKTYFHKNSANKMRVLIKEDSREKEDLRGGKKHSVHVTTFITSVIYMYVHGD